jgi:cytochrome c oxidase subunit IV
MAHTHSDNNVRTIWLVFFLLLIVTTVEVVLGIIRPEFMVSTDIIGMHLLNWTFIILTLVKAYYIVMYFMHLKHEQKNLKWVISLPSLILIPYLIFILLVEGNYINGVLM